MNDGKEDALRTIAALARHHGLSAAEIAQVLSADTKPASSLLSRLFGYLGGILIFAGLCIAIGMYWDNFDAVTRISLTLATGFTLFLMALAALSNERYLPAATPLFLAAALFQPAGLLIMMNEFAQGGDRRYGVLFMGGLMLFQHGLSFLAKRRTVLAFTSIVFGGIFYTALFDILGVSGELAGTIFGVSLICIAYALGNSRHAAIAGFWYITGSAFLLFSVFDAVRHTSYEVIYLAITTLMIFVSTLARSRALLFMSTAGMIFYIGYFTEEHFAHTLGWPISLIICGMALLGMGSLAVKLNNKYIKQKG